MSRSSSVLTVGAGNKNKKEINLDRERVGEKTNSEQTHTPNRHNREEKAYFHTLAILTNTL